MQRVIKSLAMMLASSLGFIVLSFALLLLYPDCFKIRKLYLDCFKIRKLANILLRGEVRKRHFLKAKITIKQERSYQGVFKIDTFFVN